MTSAAERVLSRFDVSRESAAALRVYAGLLVKWGSRINLTAPLDEETLWERHIADGLQLLPLLRPTDLTVVDLGSGAGIPGLVLALAVPHRELTAHLVESKTKKAAFLREAVRVTGARAVVHHERIEKTVQLQELVKTDVVTARALAPLPELLALAYPLLKGGARGLFHKGRGLQDELTDCAKCWKIASVTHPSALGEGGSIVEVLEICDA